MDGEKKDEEKKDEVRRPRLLQIHNFTAPGLNVELIPNFLPFKVALRVFHELDNQLEWTRTKSGAIFQRRLAHVFGNEGMTYYTSQPDYKGGSVGLYRKARGWPEILEYLRERVSAYTGDVYNFCVVQRYPTGKVGIQPHRDREIASGTSICGLSLGATRKIQFLQGEVCHEFELRPGSLYIMKPTTNDIWAHCIPKQPEVVETRLSLTFRTKIEY